MTDATRRPAFYVTGGTVPLTASSYLERAADHALLAALLAGDYCFVLNARQMGKSSLSVRAMATLAQAGVRTVFLDLQKFGEGRM
ncbi:MAG: AAA-like domain-containing protein [Armatimonadetes bacterium]|nr:AAA-like domain-containing protein [Armatimonadota bacterium]